MFVCKVIIGKWQGIVDDYNHKVTIKVSVIEGDGRELAAQCSLETMYIMFPPEREPHPNLAIEMLIKAFNPQEQTMLERWIDYITPILIEEGIKRGVWSA